jgi:hypothetical protein
MWLEMLKYYGLCEWIFSGRVSLLPAIVTVAVYSTQRADSQPVSQVLLGHFAFATKI